MYTFCKKDDYIEKAKIFYVTETILHKSYSRLIFEENLY